MKIHRFEDLQAWQQARVLANMVYDATDQGKFSKDFNLRHQIRDAAGSIMHNCAEGFDSGSEGEFGVFLKYVRRSASEVQSEIYLALDRQYVDELTFKQIYNKATETKKIINALKGYLRKSNYPKRNNPKTIRLFDYQTI